MYTIIGGDGREYGPVSPEQVRQWIAAGRANGETRAKVFGSEEWKQIQDFPEFAPAPALPSEHPAFSPGGFGSAEPVQVVRHFDPIDCFGRSWDLLRHNFWQLIGANAILLGLTTLAFAGLFFFLPPIDFGNPESFRSLAQSPVFSWGLRGISILFIQPLAAGVFYFFVRKARGENATLGDVWGGFTRAYLPVIVASAIVALFTVAGTICLLLPGIYLAVSYILTQVTIVDRRCGFWTGMELSRRSITKRWWSFLLLLILCAIVGCVGIIALVIGIFVAYPLCIGALAYAYLDLVPGAPANQAIQRDFSRPEGEQDNKGG